MINLAVVGETLIHKFIYPGHLNGFSPADMNALGGWMADMHKGRDGAPLDPDVRVTVIASPDQESAAAIAKACLIERVLPSVEALSPDAVDGVIILENDGNKHLPFARPFLEAGKFVYMDKPVAERIADVEEMRRLAERSGATVMGGSALRYSGVVAEAKAYMEQKAPTSVSIVGPGSWYEYACHPVETLEAIFGSRVRRVRGLGDLNRGAVAVEWESGLAAAVLFGQGHQPQFTIHAHFKDETKEWIVNDARAYYLGLSIAIARAAKGEKAHDDWADMMAVTRILEEGGRSLTAE